MNKWRIEMFGGFKVTSPDGVAVRFPTRKCGSMLALLVLSPDEPHDRDELAARLWPGSDFQDARGSLRVTLTRIRDALRKASPDDCDWMVTTRQHVKIDDRRIATDVGEFVTLMQRAKGSGTPAARARHLAEAAALYRGAFLLGQGEEWSLAPCRQWENEFFAASALLLEYLEANGDVERALHHALHAVSADPLREDSHATVLRLHLTLGQKDAALAHYRQCERLFKRRHGRKLSPETQSLVEALHRPKSKIKPLPIPRRATTPQPEKWPGGAVTLLLLDNLSPGRGEGRDTTFCRAKLREIIAQHGGHEIGALRPASLWTVFSNASDALDATVALRRAALDSPRMGGCCHTMRIALDTGDSGQWSATEFPEAPSAFHRGTLDRTLELLDAGRAGQTLCSAVTAALLRRNLPVPVSLDDLGVFRTSQGTQPERLFQVSWQGMPQRDFLPPRLPTLLTGELPAPLTSFFGREAEIKRIINSTARSRLVTLTGFGGCGKTRLAIEAAHRLKATFRDAAWFVPLAGVRDPAGIAPAIVQAMQLPGAQGLDPWRQAVGTLGAAPALLVLDNCEQIGDGAAKEIRRLLQEATGITLLVTSRNPLGVAGEVNVSVRPLPLPASKPDTGNGPLHKRWRGSVDRTPSMQLFVDRARAAQPHFTLNEGNEADVVALCHALEGVPLAIELAAAHSRAYAPRQMLNLFEERLGHDRLGLLASPHDDTPERHRTLSAAIDWSYTLLDPAAAQLFARLSVFQGGWTVPAAQAVAAPAGATENDALHALLHLQDASLVFSDDAPGEVRFAMLEMLRQFGAAKLTPARSSKLAARHADFFGELAELAAAKLMSGERELWLQTLDAESANLRVALRWFLANDPARCVQMAGALWRFWEARGAFAEGRDWLERSLAESKAAHIRKAQSTAPEHRVRALNGAGRMAWYRADFAAARRFLEECLALSHKLDAPPALQRKATADALHSLGLVAMCQGDASAPQFVEQGLELVRANGDRRVVKDFLLGLGLVRFQMAVPGAAALLEESLTISRELNDQRGISFALTNLGLLALEENRPDAARALLEQALPLLRAMGDSWSSARALQGLGRVACLENDMTSAREFFRENLRILAEAGSRWELVYTLPCFAKMALHQGKPQTAALLMAAAQNLAATTHHELFAVHRAAFQTLQADTEKSLRTACGKKRAEAVWAAAKLCGRDEAIAEAMKL